MTKYIYAFGSICRGEIDGFSDVDLLVINDEPLMDNNLNQFSHYKEETICNLWHEGNPFAWHLYKESRLIYSHNSRDFFKDLGQPRSYKNIENDFDNLIGIFQDAKESLMNDSSSAIYDLSIIFLVIRNIATCYELALMNTFNFSRDSAIKMKENKLEIKIEDYQTIKTCRILSTRGKGKEPSEKEISKAIKSIVVIENWISILNNNISYESV